MKKQLATGLLAAALSMGLVACDSGNQQPADNPNATPQSGTLDAPATRPDSNPPSQAPAEPIDPTGVTPNEPPDAGTHGIHGGTTVPEGSEESPGNEGGPGGLENTEPPVAEEPSQ